VRLSLVQRQILSSYKKSIANLTAQRRAQMELTKSILAQTQGRRRRSQIAETRVVMWNLLLIIMVSSLALIAYLKRILFDF